MNHNIVLQSNRREGVVGGGGGGGDGGVGSSGRGEHGGRCGREGGRESGFSEGDDEGENRDVEGEKRPARQAVSEHGADLWLSSLNPPPRRGHGRDGSLVNNAAVLVHNTRGNSC